ncbi:MAG: ABC transporter substrate-binding protein [Clostridiales Family XIII bacterium]|jgi:NitT/TauT family transport system substrate-binding protein|nr:ABC transporter substrate-binding protein [Clostridiales Family XIII bacterium]
MLKKSKRISLILIAVFMVAVLTFTACGSSNNGASGAGAQGGEGAPIVIKLAGTGVSATGVDPITIAIEEGYFAEQNLLVEDVGDMDVLQFVAMLENGSIDFSMTMESDGIGAIDQGAKIVEIGVAGTSTEKYPHMVFLVREDDDLHSATDLVGKKVAAFGINGCMTGFPYEYLAQAGVEDPANAIEFITSPENTLVDSLLKGDLDCVGIHGPVGVEAIERNYPGVRILFSDYTIFGEKGGDLGWYTSVKYADEHPEIVTAFLAAVGKAQNFVNDHPEEAAEIYKPLALNGISEDFFEVKNFAKDALIQQSHTEEWLRVLTEGKSFQPLDNEWTFEQVATNKYNPAA